MISYGRSVESTTVDAQIHAWRATSATTGRRVAPPLSIVDDLPIGAPDRRRLFGENPRGRSEPAAGPGIPLR